MNTDPWLGRNTIRFWYYRFKDSVYYTLLIATLGLLACLLLALYVIIPQLTNWFSIRNEVIALRSKILVINQNIQVVNNIDKSLLMTQLQIGQEALPIDKDFGEIVTALSNAAVSSGVSLDDFSFPVGEIASPSAELSTIQVEVSVAGSFANTLQFLRSIEKTLPLANITRVEGDSKAAAITIEFYQKAFPKVSLQDDQPIQPLTDSQTAFLRELATWQQTEIIPVTGSSSAVPLF